MQIICLSEGVALRALLVSHLTGLEHGSFVLYRVEILQGFCYPNAIHFYLTENKLIEILILGGKYVLAFFSPFGLLELLYWFKSSILDDMQGCAARCDAEGAERKTHASTELLTISAAYCMDVSLV